MRTETLEGKGDDGCMSAAATIDSSFFFFFFFFLSAFFVEAFLFGL